MMPAYRNDEDCSRLILEGLLEQRRAELASIPASLRRVFAQRCARESAGIAAIGAAVVLAVMTGGAMFISGPFLRSDPEHSLGLLARGNITLALILSWPFIAVVYVVSLLRADGRLREELGADVALSGDVRTDRARLEQAASVRDRVLGLLDAHERDSLTLPLAGLMLLAPLTAHLALYIAVIPFSRAPSLGQALADFDSWIALSVTLVGIAHIALAYMSYRHAGRLSNASTDVLRDKPPAGVWRTLGLTVVASLLPGAIACLIPPVLVAITGVVLIPLMFRAFRLRLLEEREALDV